MLLKSKKQFNINNPVSKSLLLMTMLFVIFNIPFAKAIQPATEKAKIKKCEKLVHKSKTSPGSVSQKELEKCEDRLNKALGTIEPRKNILTSQVQLYNLKVKRAARDLNNIDKKVKRSELELKKIEEELKKQDDKMQKIRLQLKSNILLYERNKQNLKLNLLDSSNNLTAVINRSANLNKLSQEINARLESIKKEKEVLLKKKEEAIKAKEEVEKNKNILKNEKLKLETQRRIKNDFLAETKGDEARYKELLAHIEKQKQQIINLSLLSVSTRSSIEEIKRKAKKPKDGLASTSWYYAQDDKKWGNKTIGFSRTLMKDYGCAVTALSMVFTEGGEKINPGKMAKKPMFYRDLIVWPNKWGKLKLSYGRNHGNINWGTIDSELKKKHPVIVFIRSRSGAGHYVVIHHKDKKGKYVVHDPLFGANIYLETSKKLISAIHKSGVTVDQMLIYKK